MRVDIDSLSTFNELAAAGATRATALLAQMTGIQADVEVSTISLLAETDVGRDLADVEYAGVRFDLQGGLSGDTTLVFESDCSERIVARLPGGARDPDLFESSITEIANIMLSGFVDGWADFLGTTIDHSPPTYVEATGRDVLPVADHGGGDPVFVFKNRIDWPGEGLEFYIYMLPSRTELASLVAEGLDGSDDAIPVAKLDAFNEMIQQGTATAAANVEELTGIRTESDVTHISFSPIEDVPKQVDDRCCVGTAAELEGHLSGYCLVLFDEPSAMTAVSALMGSEPDDDGFTDLHDSAIEELGNIMMSGFIDGWANVLETTIDHSPPQVVHDMGRAIVESLAAQVGVAQTHSFVIEARTRTPDVEFASQIHVLPDESELEGALAALDLDRTDQTDADVEGIFSQ
jgi:chemotaxis protein CheY-P-specific phosphatase CheC